MRSIKYTRARDKSSQLENCHVLDSHRVNAPAPMCSSQGGVCTCTTASPVLPIGCATYTHFCSSAQDHKYDHLNGGNCHSEPNSKTSVSDYTVGSTGVICTTASKASKRISAATAASAHSKVHLSCMRWSKHQLNAQSHYFQRWTSHIYGGKAADKCLLHMNCSPWLSAHALKGAVQSMNWDV